jgi:putative hydrolase of the HAD superfamily
MSYGKAVLFDLDGTLYDSEQYYLGAFREIASYIADTYNLSEIKIYQRLATIWRSKTSMYPYLFSDFLKEFRLNMNVQSIIAMFNSYKGKLHPYRSVVPIIKNLKNMHYMIGIITDGDHRRQKRKIENLGLTSMIDASIFTKDFNTNKLKKKPFNVALRLLSCKPEHAWYIGDNPILDFKGAKEIGIKTVRLKKGEFMSISTNTYIDFEISDMKEMMSYIT